MSRFPPPYLSRFPPPYLSDEFDLFFFFLGFFFLLLASFSDLIWSFFCKDHKNTEHSCMDHPTTQSLTPCSLCYQTPHPRKKRGTKNNYCPYFPKDVMHYYDLWGWCIPSLFVIFFSGTSSGIGSNLWVFDRHCTYVGQTLASLRFCDCWSRMSPIGF